MFHNKYKNKKQKKTKQTQQKVKSVSVLHRKPVLF